MLREAVQEAGDDIEPNRFWTAIHLAAAAEGKVPPPPPSRGIQPMSDEEAARFERNRIEFGKHKGELIQDVPAAYLCWIAEDEFRENLQRYICSDAFARREDS